ncbi:STAS domain-containing protein [bacterium]|nr:STAS domain-containing protein [bacterium]
MLSNPYSTDFYSGKVSIEGDSLLQTLVEYRKGILFIRLIGNLVKETVPILEIDVNTIIKENQIRYIVINMEELENIDRKGIHMLYYIYELSKKNKGNTLICNLKKEEVKKRLKQNRIFHYIKEIRNELVAFELIKI